MELSTVAVLYEFVVFLFWVPVLPQTPASPSSPASCSSYVNAQKPLGHCSKKKKKIGLIWLKTHVLVVKITDGDGQTFWE